MKLLYAALLCVLFSVSLPALDIFDYPAAEQSKEVERIFEQLASHPVIIAQFIQKKRAAGISRTFESSGLFAYHSSYGLLWDIKKPVSMVNIMSSKGLIQRFPSGKTVVMASGDNTTFDRFSRIFRSILEGDTDVIRQEFQIFYYPAADETSLSEEGWTIGLEPRDSGMRSLIRGITLSGDNDLIHLSLIETAGGSVSYEFSDTVYPDRLQDDIREKYTIAE